MIICHCNCIDHVAIEEATSRLLAEDPWRLVTPGSVYRALGKRPRCGGCLPLATSIIYAHTQCTVDPSRPCPMAALSSDNNDGEQQTLETVEVVEIIEVEEKVETVEVVFMDAAE